MLVFPFPFLQKEKEGEEKAAGIRCRPEMQGKCMAETAIVDSFAFAARLRLLIQEERLRSPASVIAAVPVL